MTRSKIVRLLSCKPHGHFLSETPLREFEGREVVVGRRAALEVNKYGFTDCDFSGNRIGGGSFSDCVFRRCRFDDVDLSNVAFQGCVFEDCVFKKSGWYHVFARDTAFQDCGFFDVDAEGCSFVGCTFTKVTWDEGGIMTSYFEACPIGVTSFNNAVVHATFRDCSVCDDAFDYVVEEDSCISFCSSEAGHISLGRPQRARRSATGGSDPLELYRVDDVLPSKTQLERLDWLLANETAEKSYQEYLEDNPGLLTLAVELGHHGMYVLPEVRFGDKYRADFMIGAKNSMGYFWTGLEIESPRHQVLKRDGEFTQKVQHAINQVTSWRNYVRTNRVAVQRRKSQNGEGLVGIEPDFKAWIIIGRDPANHTWEERRARFLDSAKNIHVQTWDGFRERIAAFVGHR